jgi:hypothetical protein
MSMYAKIAWPKCRGEVQMESPHKARSLSQFSGEYRGNTVLMSIVIHHYIDRGPYTLRNKIRTTMKLHCGKTSAMIFVSGFARS